MAKRYTQEVHQAALKRHFIGKQTAAQIGREMKIPRQTIGAWITTAKFGLKDSEWTPRRIRELCGKVKRLEDIIAVLKTVDCTAHSPVQEKLVGAAGFEPTTTCAQGRCATRLRYAPCGECAYYTIFM